MTFDDQLRQAGVDTIIRMSKELSQAKSVIEEGIQTIGDLTVQLKFWRQAAEHAIAGWNALEDRVEAAKEAIRALEGNAGAALELLGGTEEAPPELKDVT